MAETVTVEMMVGTEDNPWTAEEIDAVMSGKLKPVRRID